MNGKNNCFFKGRITKNPSDCLKKIGNGSFNLSLGLAVKSQAVDENGVPYSRTDFP